MERFCEYQSADGVVCLAHLHEARCLECPYTPADIRYGPKFTEKPVLYISKTRHPFTGTCQDFEPIEGTKEGLVKKLQEAALASH